VRVVDGVIALSCVYVLGLLPTDIALNLLLTIFRYPGGSSRLVRHGIHMVSIERCKHIISRNTNNRHHNLPST
jgi:hypothetical protein